MALAYEPGTKLFSYDDIANYVRRDHKFIPIGKEENVIRWLFRLRLFTCSFYRVSLSIADISRELKIPHTTMTSIFMRIMVRRPWLTGNILLVFESRASSSMGILVQDAATKAGFVDYTLGFIEISANICFVRHHNL